MVQTVTLENGEQHTFPDEATPEQMMAALSSHAREQKIEKFKNAMGVGKPGLAADFTAGMVSGLQGMAKMLPDIHDMVPDSMQDAIPYKKGQSPVESFDPYKFFGTEDKPFYTLGGAAQLAGELVTPVKAGLAAKPLLKVPFEAAKGAVSSGAEKVADYFSPVKHAKSLMKKLGGGAQNAEQISESLVKDIINGHDVREAEAGSFLKHATKQAGEELIYDKPDPLISTAMDKAKSITSRMKDLKIGDLYDAFKSKPTFVNGHNLQSELGVMIGDLEKNPHKTLDEARQISHLKSVRDSLKKDLTGYLEKRDAESNETLAPMYKKGLDLYREHVVPYLSSKKLRDMVRGGKTLVKDIHNMFDSPSNIFNRKTGETKIGPINKIIQDLPKSSQDKILFSRVGGLKDIENPEKMVEEFKKAQSGGYSRYFNQNLDKELQEILKKATNQQRLKTVAKYGGGGLIAGTAADAWRRGL